MTKFIYADIINGCQPILSNDAYNFGGVTECETYRDADTILTALTESVVLEVSDEIYSKVDDEYGIR